MAATLIEFTVFHFPHGDNNREYFKAMLNPQYIISVYEHNDYSIIEYDVSSTKATVCTEEPASNILFRVNTLAVHDNTRIPKSYGKL